MTLHRNSIERDCRNAAEWEKLAEPVGEATVRKARLLRITIGAGLELVFAMPKRGVTESIDSSDCDECWCLAL